MLMMAHTVMALMIVNMRIMEETLKFYKKETLGIKNLMIFLKCVSTCCYQLLNQSQSASYRRTDLQRNAPQCFEKKRSPTVWQIVF